MWHGFEIVATCHRSYQDAGKASALAGYGHGFGFDFDYSTPYSYSNFDCQEQKREIKVEIQIRSNSLLPTLFVIVCGIRIFLTHFNVGSLQCLPCGFASTFQLIHFFSDSICLFFILLPFSHFLLLYLDIFVFYSIFQTFAYTPHTHTFTLTRMHRVRNSSIIQMAFLRADFSVVYGIFMSCWHVNKRRKGKDEEWQNCQHAKNRISIDKCRQQKYAFAKLKGMRDIFAYPIVYNKNAVCMFTYSFL